MILAGYMRVVKAPLLQAFPNRVINIHPSLLPAFKGLHAWEQALTAGVTETGCTVHFVNEEVDGGAIIAQERVPVARRYRGIIARAHPSCGTPAISGGLAEDLPVPLISNMRPSRAFRMKRRPIRDII